MDDMKKDIPFPIEILDRKIIEELTPIQFGILMRFIQRLWKSGDELPKNEYQLYNIARCPFKQWSMARERVYEAMKVVIPLLVEARKRKMVSKQNLSNNATKLHAERRLGKYNKKQHFTEENQDKKLIITAVPKTHEETAWNKGQFDPIMRKMALKSNEENKGKKTLFYDKPKD